MTTDTRYAELRELIKADGTEPLRITRSEAFLLLDHIDALTAERDRLRSEAADFSRAYGLILAERDQLAKDALQQIANDACGRIPDDFVVSICFENGAAYCELTAGLDSIELPDSADKTIMEQLQDVFDVIDAALLTHNAEGGK